MMGQGCDSHLEPFIKSGGLGEPWNKGINKNERMEASSGRHSR